MADPTPPVDPPAARANGQVLSVAIGYLEGQANELLTRDPEVRAGSPEAAHQMGAATRRLRSALDTYRSLFDKDATNRLRDELKWLARNLGRPREAEVLRESLRARLSELPGESGGGPVAAPIEHVLGTACNAGYIQLRDTLDSVRYRRLLADLGNFLAHPPANDRAGRPARIEGARLVNNVSGALDRAHRAAGRTTRGEARDVALHEVRNEAKRLLHAAESLAGIYPKQAKALARGAHRLQRILGGHQDSVVTRAFLDSLAADPALPQAARLAYHRIRDIEEDAADSAHEKYATFLKKAPALRLRH